MSKQLIVALVLALCLVHSCSAIKCYSCRSTVDKMCSADKVEDLKMLNQVDCDMVARIPGPSAPLPVTKCNKVVTQDRAGTIVSRDCHFEEFGDDPNTCKVSHSQKVVGCDICKGDLCNSATGYTAMGVAALLAVVVATLNL